MVGGWLEVVMENPVENTGAKLVHYLQIALHMTCLNTKQI